MAVNGAKKETGPSCALLGPKAGESPVLALVPRAEGVDHACEVSSTSQTEVRLLSEPPTTMWGPSTSCPRPPRSCWRAGLGADALGTATLCRPGGRWLPRCVLSPTRSPPALAPPPEDGQGSSTPRPVCPRHCRPPECHQGAHVATAPTRVLCLLGRVSALRVPGDDRKSLPSGARGGSAKPGCRQGGLFPGAPRDGPPKPVAGSAVLGTRGSWTRPSCRPPSTLESAPRVHPRPPLRTIESRSPASIRTPLPGGDSLPCTPVGPRQLRQDLISRAAPGGATSTHFV